MKKITIKARGAQLSDEERSFLANISDKVRKEIETNPDRLQEYTIADGLSYHLYVYPQLRGDFIYASGFAILPGRMFKLNVNVFREKNRRN